MVAAIISALVAGNPSYCIANGRDTAADYVRVNVTNCSIFRLTGSPKATPTPSGGSSGGSGTYPPGWFGTQAPAVTATKAPAASATATDAPPGERVTPAPTKAKPAATTTPAKGAPRFTAVFAAAGVLAAAEVGAGRFIR